MSCNLYGQLSYRPDVPVGIPGASTTGGRNASAAIYIVDTLTNASWRQLQSGGVYDGYYRASLRGAFDTTGYRYILPAISGYIIVPYGTNSEIIAGGGNFTYFGQTAPGRLIVRNTGIRIDDRSDNVIIQHFTAMIGDSVQSVNGQGERVFNCEAEGIQLMVRATGTSNLTNVVLDQCTLLYGIDGSLGINNNTPDLYKVDSILVRRSLIGASIDIPPSPYSSDNIPPVAEEDCAEHSRSFVMGVAFGAGDVVDQTKSIKQVVSLENIITHSTARNPLVNANLTLANNVISHMGARATYLRNEGASGTPGVAPTTTMNIVSNYYKVGPWTDQSPNIFPVRFGEGGADTLVAASRVYLADNQNDLAGDPIYLDPANVDQHATGTLQNGMSGWGLQLMGAEHLVGYLVPRVGADYRYRTVNETSILNDVTNGTGTYSSAGDTLIESLTNLTRINGGGFPSVTSTKVTLSIPASPNGDSDADGYSNLEEWVYDNYTLPAEYQLNTILHGSWERENYPWMMDTFAQLEKRMAQQ